MPEIYQPAEDSYLLSESLEKSFANNKNKKDIDILEIGCGSGVQLQKLLEIGIKKENIFGADVNDRAVEHCKKLGFNVVLSNLFSNIKGKYDLIIFNPPYLPEDKKEPKSSQIATTGGKKGGEIINRFLKQAGKHLNKGGKIILLASSLTKGIDFAGYDKKPLAEKKLFFEALYVLELIRSG